MAADLGFTDAALAGAAEHQLEYLYAGWLTPPGCWLGCEGGIGTWLAERRRATDEEHEKRKFRQRMAERFINPYTFVPFPERIDRREPSGHHLLADGNLSGIFTVTWAFTSPFQAPEGQSGMTMLRLPGSSVKGAVRSVHEALAGGCLRVFDEEFIPSYRDQARLPAGDWSMANRGQGHRRWSAAHRAAMRGRVLGPRQEAGAGLRAALDDGEPGIP